MKELYELKEMLLDKLKEYSKKGDLTSGSLDVVDKLSHATKNICKIIEEYEEESGYSRRQPMYYDDYSYARRRDSMGRYSRDSRGGGMIHELRELMEDAPDEATKKEFQRFIQKMEQM
jgi:hypothetical protein